MRKAKGQKGRLQTLICNCGKVHKKVMICLCEKCNNGKAWRKAHPHYNRDWARENYGKGEKCLRRSEKQ